MPQDPTEATPQRTPHEQALHDILNLPVQGLNGVEVMHSLQAIAKAALEGKEYNARNPIGLWTKPEE